MLRVTMTGDNLNVLQDLKRRLSESGKKNSCELRGGQWDALRIIARELTEACDRYDLEGVARLTRQMKNRLRKRAYRRTLEALESGGVRSEKVGGEALKDKGKNAVAKRDDSRSSSPDGSCKCNSCGSVIDGTSSPCISGALCTKCALKKKADSAEKDSGELRRSGDSESSTRKNEESAGNGPALRRRQW